MHKKISGRFVAALCVLSLGAASRPAIAADASADGNKKSKGEAAPKDLKSLDAVIAAAAMRVGALQANEKELQSRCLQSFSESKLSEPSYAANFTFNESDHAQAVAKSLVCRALTSDDVGACDKLGSKAPDCRDLLEHLVGSKVLATAPRDPAGAKRLCSTMLRELPAGGCDVIVANAADSHQVAAKLAALFKKSPDFLEDKIRLDMGLDDAQTCAAMKKKDWPGEAACTTARAYRSAYVKRDAVACGDSGLCRAMMGLKAGACDGYADAVRTTYCANGSTSEATPAKGQFALVAREEEGGLRRTLRNLGAAQFQGVDMASRREQVTGLLNQCVEMEGYFGWETPKAAPAKSRKRSR